MHHLRHVFTTALCLVCLQAALPANALAQSFGAQQLSAEDQMAKENYAYSVAMQAYVFTFPLTIVERERKMRLVDKPRSPFAPVAAINQLGHMRKLATAKDPLPYSPNLDTIYTGVVLELGAGPIVMNVPDVFDRYISIEIADAYTNNLPYQLGTSISGGKGGNILFAGPDWKGVVPAGMKLSRAPSNTLLVAVRIRIDGVNDMPNVAAIQNKISLTALSDWDGGNGMGKKPVPVPPLMARPSYKGDFAYFRTVADLMAENPPAAEHAAALKNFEFLGLHLGKPFNPDSLDEPTRRGILRAEKDGPVVMKWSTHQRGYQLSTGWGTALTGGTYGFDYLARAEDALSGLIQNDLEEAMYFISYTDASGQPLVGGKKYKLHFDKGHLPTVQPKGFWSFTLYDGDRFQYIDNPLNRYSLGARMNELKFNADGSLDLYVQPESPGSDKESNWLPSSKSGPLRMNIRVYLPTSDMLKVDMMEKRIPPIIRMDD